MVEPCAPLAILLRVSCLKVNLSNPKAPARLQWSPKLGLQTFRTHMLNHCYHKYKHCPRVSGSGGTLVPHMVCSNQPSSVHFCVLDLGLGHSSGHPLLR